MYHNNKKRRQYHHNHHNNTEKACFSPVMLLNPWHDIESQLNLRHEFENIERKGGDGGQTQNSSWSSVQKKKYDPLENPWEELENQLNLPHMFERIPLKKEEDKKH